MKKKRFSIKIFDVLILSIILFFIVFAGFFLYTKKTEKVYLFVESPHGQWIYSLTQDRIISVPGKIGITEIQIKNNLVTVINSVCPNHTCVAAPPLCRVGDWNACLPNRVFLSIQGKQINELDPDV